MVWVPSTGLIWVFRAISQECLPQQTPEIESLTPPSTAFKHVTFLDNLRKPAEFSAVRKVSL